MRVDEGKFIELLNSGNWFHVTSSGASGAYVDSYSTGGLIPPRVWHCDSLAYPPAPHGPVLERGPGWPRIWRDERGRTFTVTRDEDTGIDTYTEDPPPILHIRYHVAEMRPSLAERQFWRSWTFHDLQVYDNRGDTGMYASVLADRHAPLAFSKFADDYFGLQAPRVQAGTHL